MTQQESYSRAKSPKERVYHPLLNVALPGTAELRARCGDSDSIQVLDAACWLADMRCRSLDDVREAVLEHSRKPYIGKTVLVEAAREPELTETDIVRALLAFQQPYLASALFDSKRTHCQPSEPFHRMADQLREAMKPCHQLAPSLPVAASWARRWALMFLENPTLQIGVSTWVRSVMHAMPPDFSNVFVSGHFTVDETREFMDRAFRTRLKTQVDPAPPAFPKCPPAYFDRHGLLDVANDLLTTSKGVFLVGNDAGPMHNLIRAISSDVNYCPDFKALEDIRCGGGRLFSADSPGLRNNSGANRTVFALTGNVPEEAGGQAWCFDLASLAYEDRACESLGFFRWLTGKEAEGSRYVIAMHQDEWDALVEAVPEVARLPRLDVPAAEDVDVIPAFLMSLPEVLERHDCSVPLDLLLDFLYQTSLSCPAYLTASHASELIDLVRPERIDLGLLNVLPFNGQHRTPFARWSRRSIPMKIKLVPAKLMAAEAEPFFSKYIGDLSCFESLIVLYETVTLLSEADPSPRVIAIRGSSGISSALSAKPASKAGSSAKLVIPKIPSADRSYVRTASALPVPTAAQTARFASFVADAHSWYKHLPLHPMTPFFFFLDPTAGMKPQGLKVIRHADSDVEEYRERFGHWNYHADEGRTLLGGIERWKREGSPVEVGDPAPKIQDIDGETLVIPSRLMLAGMTKLSAFVHVACSIQIWTDMARTHRSRNPFTYVITLDHAPQELPDDLRAIWACFNTPNWYPPFESGQLAEYAAHVAALAADPAAPVSWREESRLMKMARELGGEHLYEQVLVAVEMRRTITSRKDDFEFLTGSSPNVQVRALIDHLVYERMRQIQSMKDAMHRFIGGLS